MDANNFASRANRFASDAGSGVGIYKVHKKTSCKRPCKNWAFLVEVAENRSDTMV